MHFNIKLLCPLVLVATSACAGSNDVSTAHTYITDKIAQYSAAVERCEKVANNRPLPDESVIKDLSNYSMEDVRAFLITRSAAAAEVCEKPELTDLAYAIGVLEGADVSGEPKEIVQNIRSLIFEQSTWGLKKKYLELPVTMRDELEKTSYFNEPFNDIAIFDALKSHDK